MLNSSLLWLILYGCIRLLIQFVNEKSVKSKHGLSHRIYVIIYTFYCLIFGSIQFENLEMDTVKVMGILNVTPDSFYDGGNYNNKDLDQLINIQI